MRSEKKRRNVVLVLPLIHQFYTPLFFGTELAMGFPSYQGGEGGGGGGGGGGREEEEEEEGGVPAKGKNSAKKSGKNASRKCEAGNNTKPASTSKGDESQPNEISFVDDSQSISTNATALLELYKSNNTQQNQYLLEVDFNLPVF